MRSILVTGLIHKDLRDSCESTEEVGLKSFEGRKCKACPRSQALIRDIERTFNFRRNADAPGGYGKKMSCEQWSRPHNELSHAVREINRKILNVEYQIIHEIGFRAFQIFVSLLSYLSSVT